MGDFNSKVGRIVDSNEKGVVGNFGLGERNDCGERLVEFAMENEMAITNPMFMNHKRRLYTWTSPDGDTKNQIDYILVNRSWRTSVSATRTLPGADCGSDHEMLMCEFKFRLKCFKKSPEPIRYDLQEIPLNILYKIEIKNRFRALLDTAEEMEPNEMAREITQIYKEAAANHLPKKEITKKPWITKETIEAIEKRKTTKQKNGYSTTEYREAQKHVKQLLNRDKKDFLHQKLFDIETSQAKLKHKKMFEGINNLTKKFTPRLSVIKDKHNKVLTESEEISRRWTEYCTEMYDGPTTKMVQMAQNGEELEPLRSEVKWAINQLPLGNSAGNDAIHGEMIKASGEEEISIYHKLCTKIWKEEKWPSEWTKAVFVPIPKKGDLQQCTYYRTIALISHASKILLKIIMKRLQRKLDEEINQT